MFTAKDYIQDLNSQAQMNQILYYLREEEVNNIVYLFIFVSFHLIKMADSNSVSQL